VKSRATLGVLVALLGLVGPGLQPALASEPVRLRLATTTSTENSGLLAYILPDFEKKYDLKVDVIAVGTGAALKLGEKGDADLVLAHAPDLEEAFVKSGFGVDRKAVMKNEFIIIGPANDPAKVKSAKDAAAAMAQIKQNGAVFISRGDESGTHQKEKALWAKAGGKPDKNYLEAGQGMEQVLFMANEKKAYTLSDRGTYLAVMDKLDLKILFEHDPMLDNPYSVIAVNPKLHPNVKYKEAELFINWITSPEVQAKIKSFQKHGQVLFWPTAAEPPEKP
jgi:tungstate transport system substrate-binding protein